MNTEQKTTEDNKNEKDKLPWSQDRDRTICLKQQEKLRAEEQESVKENMVRIQASRIFSEGWGQTLLEIYYYQPSREYDNNNDGDNDADKDGKDYKTMIKTIMIMTMMMMSMAMIIMIIIMMVVIMMINSYFNTLPYFSFSPSGLSGLSLWN